MAGLIRLMTDVDDLADMLDGRLKIETKEAWRAAMKKFQPDQFDCRGACHAGNTLLYLILKEVFWYELPRTGPLETCPWVLGGCTYLVGS